MTRGECLVCAQIWLAASVLSPDLWLVTILVAIAWTIACLFAKRMP